MNSLSKGLLTVVGVGAGAVWTARMLIRRSRWFSFAGKTVLVTGGSRGLGLVLARRLIDAGARVAICARTEEDLEAVEQELRERGGEVLSKFRVMCGIATKCGRWSSKSIPGSARLTCSSTSRESSKSGPWMR